ncbi:MAG: NAD(P)-dependent oxidoreductase [Candidatus Woesearchaeota archaeon]|jgi:NADH dehydrogenase
MKNILITGISGNLGRELVDYFLKDRYFCKKYSLYGLIRSESKVSNIPKEVKLIRGSLDDVKKLNRILKNIHVVIHLAATMSTDNPLEMDDVNYLGTKNLMLAAQKNNVKHFIFISSVAATSKFITPYGLSKRKAEKELREGSQLNWTILRPAMILNKNNQLLKDISANYRSFGLVPMIGWGNNKVQYVYSRDVCAAIKGLIFNPLVYHKCFYVLNKNSLTRKDFMRKIVNHIIGKKVRIIPVPVFITLFIAAIYQRITHRTLLTKYGVKEIVQGVDYQKDNLFELLKINPKSLDEILTELSLSNHP